MTLSDSDPGPFERLPEVPLRIDRLAVSYRSIRPWIHQLDAEGIPRPVRRAKRRERLFFCDGEHSNWHEARDA